MLKPCRFNGGLRLPFQRVSGFRLWFRLQFRQWLLFQPKECADDPVDEEASEEQLERVAKFGVKVVRLRRDAHDDEAGSNAGGSSTNHATQQAIEPRGPL